MPTIEMSKYRPYATMGKTCETREIREKKVVWPYIEKDILNGKFKGRIIRKTEMVEAAELWRMSYPEVYGSSATYEWVLYPEEYEGKVVLKENWEKDAVDKTHFMPVVEETETGTLVAGSLFTKDDKNLHVEYSLGAIHPEYRKGKTGERLTSVALELLNVIEEKTGVEYLTAFCETWHSISQYLCFKQWGWKIAGIFPGQFTRWNGGQREYRGCEVHFYKLIVAGEKYTTKPEEWQLIPEVKKVWEVLEEINKEADDSALNKYRKRSK